MADPCRGWLKLTQSDFRSLHRGGVCLKALSGHKYREFSQGKLRLEDGPISGPAAYFNPSTMYKSDVMREYP